MAASSTNAATKSDLIAHAKDAHYHAVTATAKWKAFAEAMKAEATSSPAARLRKSRQRAGETTYAKGELGGH